MKRMSDVEVSEAAGEHGTAVRLRTPERRQIRMVVQCPDDLVGPTHAVRMVMAVVEKLDVARFCEPIQAREGRAGRDATDPQLLIGLWLYACIRGIGSARELARRREESAAFQWLCGGVSVNHRLLSEFRTGHGEALDELFTQVIASLVDKEVVKVSRISQDGTRVRMSAGASGFVGQSGWRSCWQKRSSMWRSCGNRWTRRSMLRKSRPGGRE
jgi:transposase